ncbi:unnamed protein product [Rotaria magnacalcarata]|uniref:Uncharacterized protein n=1 Tax=Rotaria magnacalcarata TaxID=392030 RepID=A0A8S3B618_9BILA|nr:unnamed protein product [Rotaria magnacalcarata]
MGRKAVDIATKRTIILLRDSGMSQYEIFRKLNISRHCIGHTISKFNKLHTVTTKPGAGRRSKLTDCQKLTIKLQQVIFTDESNFEILNRKNRIYIRRFRNDLKRFERSQSRVHKGPIVFYNGSLHSDEYIGILGKHLPTAFEKFLSQPSRKILLQQDNARPYVSNKTRKYLKKKTSSYSMASK